MDNITHNPTKTKQNDLKYLSNLREQADYLGIEYTSKTTIPEFHKLLYKGLSGVDSTKFMTERERINYSLEPVRVIVRPNDPDLEGVKSITLNIKNRTSAPIWRNAFHIPLNQEEGFYIPRYLKDFLTNQYYYFKDKQVRTIDVGGMNTSVSTSSQFQKANKYAVIELPKQSKQEYIETARDIQYKLNNNKGMI